MDFVNIVADAFRASSLPGNLHTIDNDTYADVMLVLPKKTENGESLVLSVVRRKSQGQWLFASCACEEDSGQILYGVPTFTEAELGETVAKLIDWTKQWVSSTPT